MKNSASFLSLNLLLTTIISIRLPSILCQNNTESWFSNCTNLFRCGAIEAAGYPFWGGSRPAACGRPGLRLTCESNYPVIDIMSVKYRVLEINSSSQIIRIIRNDFAEDDICPDEFVNSIVDLSLFEYTSGYVNLTVQYGYLPLGFKVPARLNCRVKGGNYRNVYVVPGAQGRGLCRASVFFPILSTRFGGKLRFRDIGELVGSGFELRWKEEGGRCTECRNSGGSCGFDLQMNQFCCLCPSGLVSESSSCRRSDFVSSAVNQSGTTRQLIIGSTTRRLIIGLSGAAGLVTISIMIYCLAKRCSCSMEIFNWRSDEGGNPLVGDQFMQNYGSIASRPYTYQEIRKITNSFADKLGHGGYGCVYRGMLSDGRDVAVKVLNGGKGDGEDFINEVAAISRTSHVNVVALLGFCSNNRKRALIYEFMPKGSLDKFIGWKESTQLEWKLLYEIALGIARGLEYLHRGCNTRIVHLDIKPQNILLDANFHPKISDFGLAKIYKNKESVLSTMGARGTMGYIAPEMVFPSLGGVSHKSDVYSYGMMVLEMVGLTGKSEINPQQTSETYFPNWIHERVELGEEIPLKGVTNEEEKESAMKMIYVGLWCIQPNPFDRPSISKVVEMLEGSLDSLQIPPRPYLASSTTMNFDKISWTTSSVS